MPATLILADSLRAQLTREARAVFPRECCGLIEGERDGGTVRAVALHPVRNLAPRADRFAIDPAAQFHLMRELRGTARAIVGCYHSHPNGRAEPSAADCESAGEDGFVWLIAALQEASGEIALAAFVPKAGVFTALAIRP